MFGRLLGMLSADMAIDLGTANTLVAACKAYLHALNKLLVKRQKTAPAALSA